MLFKSSRILLTTDFFLSLFKRSETLQFHLPYYDQISPRHLYHHHNRHYTKGIISCPKHFLQYAETAS